MKGYDKQCYTARREYHRAKNKHNKHKTTFTFNAMKKKSINYEKEITRVKNKEKSQIVKKLRENKSKDPKSYWNILKGKQGSNKESDITLDVFYDHFKQLLSDGGNNTNDHINYKINGDDNSLILDGLITAEEVKLCISKLKNNKSPGYDNIINEYIKSTQNLLCPLYVKLFNKIINEGVFPLEWTIGVIVPLYKNKGDINDTNNYRGITLSCMGKLFTSLLNDRLKHFSEANNIINKTQTAFREGYSTLDHIYLLKCIIDLFKWRKRKLFCLFVDY